MVRKNSPGPNDASDGPGVKSNDLLQGSLEMPLIDGNHIVQTFAPSFRSPAATVRPKSVTASCCAIGWLCLSHSLASETALPGVTQGVLSLPSGRETLDYYELWRRPSALPCSHRAPSGPRNASSPLRYTGRSRIYFGWAIAVMEGDSSPQLSGFSLGIEQ